ncbi:MAG: PKD domain-containing protein [Bacteroidales bacterium]|nr:PKD domain-containing protein [Bacteroidales bacterium]
MIVRYSDGTSTFWINDITSPTYQLEVSPAASTTYKVETVADINCTGAASGTAIVTVPVVSTVEFVGPASRDICAGKPEILEVAFDPTTNGPWQLTYSMQPLVGGLPSGTPVVRTVAVDAAMFNTEDHYEIQVRPTQTVRYRLESVISGGCTGTVDGLPIDVLVGQLPAQPGTIVGSVEVCQGATATFSVPALPGVSHYVWTLPGGVEVESGRELTTTFAEDAVSGRLSVYAVNACGDGSLQYMDLVINPLPDASKAVIDGTEDICQGSKGVVFTVDAIPHTETYNWSLSVGTIVSGQGSAQISVDFADEVDHFNGVVSVQAKNGCGTAVDLVSKAFRVRPLPVPNAGADQSLCEDFVTLNATPLTAAELAAGAKGRWLALPVSGSADAISEVNNPNVTVTGLSRGDVTFRWMVTSQYGCESYDEVTVRNNQLLVSAWAESDAVCSGTAQLRGTNPDASLSVSGQWTVVEPVGSVAVFDDATSSSAMVSNMSTGRNVFKWTLNQNGCPSSAEVVIMNNQPADAVILGPAIVSTCGDPVTLEAEAPGVDWGTGLWSLISGYAHIVLPNSATTVVHELNFGDTELQWTVTKGHCQTSARVIIRNNKVWVDAGPEQDLCSVSTVLEGSPVPAGASGSWHVISGAATFANGSNPATAVSALGRGENVLEWRINKNGCISSDRVSIWNNSATVATVGSAFPVCEELPTLSGNEPLLSEETGYWSVVSGSGTFVDASQHNTQVSDLAFGENVFRWTINNNDKCSSSADLKITNLKTFVDAGKDTVICQNPVILRANPSPAGMTGAWTIVPGKGGGTIVVDDPSKPHIIRVGLDQGSNELVWTINNRGCYSTDPVVVLNSRPFPVDAGPAYRLITGTETYMQAEPPGEGQNGTWLLMSGGADIVQPNDPKTFVQNLRRGENVFRWVVTNGHCSEYAEVVIVNGDVVDANAGRDDVICGSSTRLNANDPEGALGSWSRVKGTAVFANPYDPRTQVSNLAPGENILRWTITYGSSGSSTTSSDEVVIYNNQPATARTMDDAVKCDDNLIIRANAPGMVGSEPMGTPFWEIVSGAGDLADPNAPETLVENLAKGVNVLVYTITKVHEVSNKTCFSRDTLEVINGLPTTPVAGESRPICTDEYLLNPNIPEHGVGSWRSGSVGGATFDGNRVYNLAQGDNELIYEIATEWCTLESSIVLTNNKPSDSYAGRGRDVCTSTFTMEARTVQYGIGTWEKVSGGGVIAPEDLNNPVARVENLSSGSNRFRWVVDNNGCTSVSEVEIRYNFIASDAGEDLEICEDFTWLNGSNPMQGEGTWGVKGGSGSAIFEDVNDPLTRVSGLDRGPNVLTWTVNNVNCPSVSEVLVYNNQPTVPEAGDNQSGLCEPETILQGNTPAAGVGRWTVISGSATFNSESYAEAELDPNARAEGQNAGYEGCSLSDEVVLTYNKVEAFAGNDAAACADERVLSARNPSPGTGMWSVPGGQGAAVFEDPTSPNTRVRNLGRGPNTLRWTVWHNGCSTYDEVVIDNQLPSRPYAGNDQTLCADEALLDATPPEGGSTGSWRVVTGSAVFENETDPKTAVSGLAKGDNIFIWTTERIEGCVLEDQVLVRNHEPSDPYAGANYEEICTNTFTLKATTPEYGSGIWSFEQGGGGLSDPNDPEAVITALNPGRNLLRWTVSQGQCDKYAEVEIINNTPTKANAGPDIEDCKDVQTLDANVPVHYDRAYWERISGYGELDDLEDPKTPIRNLAFGANEFQWVIENGSCRSTDRVIIFNQIPDKAFAGSDQLGVCDTYTVLNANDPVTGAGQWSVIKGKGAFDDAAQYNTIVRNLGFGENIYRWEVAYGECSTVDEVAIVSHKTEAYAGEDQVVYEPEAVLNANNAGELDAHWLIVGTSTATFADETFFNTAVYNLSDGINTFGWEVDVNGCISYDQVSVDYRPVPDAGFITNVDEGCYPLRVQFTNYSVGGSVYQWSFGDGSTSADRNPVHVYTEPGAYMVQLNAPGPDGMDGVFTQQILVYDHPVADFTVNPTVVYVPGENARFYDLSTDAVSWYWDFGDGQVSTERNPSYQYREEGVYDVSLMVSNGFDCKDTLIVEAAVTAEPQGFVVFPNAFKPRPGNASGQVDPSAEYVVVFKPAYRDVDAFTLEIFNRWGQKIFETNDIDSGWDGMYEGQMAPQAVYIYKATGKYYNGREFRNSGSVLLVR